MAKNLVGAQNAELQPIIQSHLESESTVDSQASTDTMEVDEPSRKRLKLSSLNWLSENELACKITDSIIENHVIMKKLASYMTILDVCLCLHVSKRWEKIWGDILLERVGGSVHLCKQTIHANVAGLIPTGNSMPSDLLALLMRWKTLQGIQFIILEDLTLIKAPPTVDLMDVVASVAKVRGQSAADFDVQIFKAEAVFFHGSQVDIMAMKEICSCPEQDPHDKSHIKTFCKILGCTATILWNGQVHVEGTTFNAIKQMASRVKALLLALETGVL